MKIAIGSLVLAALVIAGALFSLGNKGKPFVKTIKSVSAHSRPKGAYEGAFCQTIKYIKVYRYDSTGHLVPRMIWRCFPYTSQPTPIPQPTLAPQPTPQPTVYIQPTRVPTDTPSGGNYASTCQSSGQDCDLALLDVINADRTTHGAQPLVLDPAMSYGTSTCIGAHGHALHMSQVGYISHDQFPGDVCSVFYTAAENVGMAGGLGEWQALLQINRQMLSEPWTPGCTGSHVCSLRQPSLKRIGIGIVYGGGSTWLAEDFVG